MDLPISIVSTDFDGTVHSESERPPVSAALQDRIGRLQARGVKWVINTGRDLDSLSTILRAADLSIQPDYLVVVEREIHVRQGSTFRRELPWNERCAEEQARLFARVESELPAVVDWIHRHFSATVYRDDYSPFCLIAASNPDADAILTHVERSFRHLPELALVRNDVYARFSHRAYNKGTALSELARLNGVTSAAVLAAGDHYNDLPMLRSEHAQYLVAPANAIPEVKTQVRRQGGFVSALPWSHGVVEGLDYHLDAARSLSGRRPTDPAERPAPRTASVFLPGTADERRQPQTMNTL